MPRKSPQPSVSIEALLRSINVRMDATEPDRIAHFRPTAKSIPFLEALLGRRESRAWLITAPYGTGKSLAAAFILHLVENRPDSRVALKGIEPHLRKVSPSLANFAGRRRRNGTQGLVLALDGYEADLPTVLINAVLESMDRLKLGRQARSIRAQTCRTMRDAVALLDTAQQKAAEAGFDRCVILWDEFGRHLESLVDQGRAGELADVQVLAEYVARSPQLPISLGVLLHQRLLQYADRASHSVRIEWAKVEGRFAEHHYIDDSRELFRLLGDVIATRRPNNLDIPKKVVFQRAAQQALKLNLFDDWTKQELAQLLENSYPLEPATLALLPMISGRVAQNERTLFAFLYDQPLSEPIGPDALYSYFSPAMRADTGIGGTHRRWLETESALSKANDAPPIIRALTAACLLGLGNGGERARAGMKALEFSVAGYGDYQIAIDTIGQLLGKKLLIHRKHTDQVSLWHGTDLDVRSRLEETKARERDAFDLIDFLNVEAPPPIWKPVAHNDSYDIRRYFDAEYITVHKSGARDALSQNISPFIPGADGRVIYVLAENQEAVDEAIGEVTGGLLHDRLIIAIPREPIALTETALEIQCLRQLQQDPEVVGDDPLASSELEQFADDARTHLKRLVDRIIWPGSDGPRWFYQGKELDIQSPRVLRTTLSRLMNQIFHLTPRLRNEMINRHQPSRVLVNARKKVQLGILEREGTENLGLTGQTPDTSIFRTALLQSGLYRKDNTDRWGFAQPQELSDEGLKAVWLHLKAFFTVPHEKPKEPRLLFDELVEPPYGLRKGLLPILIAAAYKAFPAAIAITRDGEYLNDILASEIEDLVRNPDRYRVKVLSLTGRSRKYLEAIFQSFAADEDDLPNQGDLIRDCYDAIASWREKLPPAALSARNVSTEAQALQQALERNLDPIELLFNTFPKISGKNAVDISVAVQIRAAKDALEGVADQYAAQAADSVRRILLLAKANGGGAIKAGQDWAACFPALLVDHLPDERLSGLITRLRTSYKRDRQLVDSLGFLLIGKPVQRWDDASLTAFERELHAAARRVEEAALSLDLTAEDLGAGSEQLADLAQLRMQQWYARYRELVGETAAKAAAESLSKH